MAAPKATAAKAASIADQLQQPPAKKVKTDDSRAVNDAQTYMNMLVDGKVRNATEEQVALAKIGKDILKTCNKEDKVAFARKVEQSKGSKNFAWVREFRESLSSKTLTTETAKENYYTRNVRPDI